MENQSAIKKEVFVGLFWKFGERITAQLISLVVSIVLARLLLPDDYGAVALVMIFITLANVFVSSGLGSALIQKKDVDNLDFSSVFYINIAVSIGIYALIFITAPLVAKFYNLPVIRPVLRVLGIRVVIAAINSVQHAYVSRNMLFKRFFWATLFGTLVSGCIGVAMAYRGFGVWALVVQYLTNTTIDTIVLWFTVRWRPLLKCSWERSKGLISYGWKLLVSALLDTGYTQLRSLIIGKVYSSTDLAYYNQGDKYPGLLCININSSINSVLFPAMSKYQTEPEKVKQMTRRSIQVSSYVIWPLTLGLAAVAKPLVSLLLTDKWLPCVPFLKIFCITYGLWPIHTANLQAINALGRSDLFLRLEVIKKSIGLVALLISIKFGPMAIALSLVVVGVVNTFVNSHPNKGLLNYSYVEQLKDLLPSFIIAVIMATVVSLIDRIGLSNILTLGIQIPLGAFIYMGLSIVTKQSALFYLLGFLRRKEQGNIQ